jgi:DNA replication initiation complex subunit (GINS family)
MPGGRDFDYDTLAEALGDERATKDLVALRRGFVSDVVRVIGEARAALKKAEAKDSDSADAEMARQNMKMLRTKVRQIVNLRVEKLARAAVHAAQTGKPTPVESMLEDEMRLYSAFHSLARLFATRLQTLAGIESPEKVEELERDAARSLSGLVPSLALEEPAPEDLVTIHILSDVGEFVWKGGERLSPRKGDVMNVPRGLAEVLLGNGSAERAE